MHGFYIHLFSRLPDLRKHFPRNGRLNALVSVCGDSTLLPASPKPQLLLKANPVITERMLISPLKLQIIVRNIAFKMLIYQGPLEEWKEGKEGKAHMKDMRKCRANHCRSNRLHLAVQRKAFL